MSCLAFGASALGGVFGAVDEGDGMRAVHAALDGGINYIDVSPFYGLTKAETVLGRALKGINRERYYLSTKCGRYGHDFTDFDFSADRVTRSIDESLTRLGVSHVDLLFAHDIEFGNLEQVIHETLPAMAKIKQQGKARYIGVSGLPLKVFTTVVSQVPEGTLDAVLSYCHYGLNDTSLLSILPELEAKGIGVVSAAPLSMGLLTPQGPPDWHPAPQQLKQKCGEAAAHCAAKGKNLSKLAVQYALAEPRIATTLVSADHPQKVETNLACMDEPIDEQLLAEVLQILEPVHNVTWPSGRAENN
ncbi:MAG: aldo/keto reductase [bacterium]